MLNDIAIFGIILITSIIAKNLLLGRNIGPFTSIVNYLRILGVVVHEISHFTMCLAVGVLPKSLKLKYRSEYSRRPAELSQIKGINSRQIKLLQESGVSTAEALAKSSIESVSSIDGLGDKTAKKLIWNARSALGMTEFISTAEIDENVEHITTGSSELNRILGGGVSTGKLTEVYGPFKSGKTALSHTIAVTVQLPKSKGGLNGSVAYIDTENTFSKEKIKRIAKRFGLDPDTVLSKLYHARIYSSDHQDQMTLKAETLCKTRSVKLLIMDSLMALLRAEYVRIRMLARRQAVLNNMLHALSRIAETYECAVLLTNQVATKMMGMFSSNDAIGGNDGIMAHNPFLNRSSWLSLLSYV